MVRWKVITDAINIRATSVLPFKYRYVPDQVRIRTYIQLATLLHFLSVWDSEQLNKTICPTLDVNVLLQVAICKPMDLSLLTFASVTTSYPVIAFSK